MYAPLGVVETRCVSSAGPYDLYAGTSSGRSPAGAWMWRRASI
jgi:hypothetical protein